MHILLKAKKSNSFSDDVIYSKSHAQGPNPRGVRCIFFSYNNNTKNMILFWAIILLLPAFALATETEKCDVALHYNDQPLENIPEQVLGNDYEGSEEELKSFYQSLQDIRSIDELPEICSGFSVAIEAICKSGQLDGVVKDFIHLNTLPEQICGPEFQGVRFKNGDFIDGTGNEKKFYESYRCRSKIWRNMQLTLQGREKELVERTGIRWRSPVQFIREKLAQLRGRKPEPSSLVDTSNNPQVPVQATARLLLRNGFECRSVRHKKPLLGKIMSVLRDLGELALSHKYDIIFLVTSFVILAVTAATTGGAALAAPMILLLAYYSVSALYTGLFFAYQVYLVRQKNVVMRAFLDQLQPSIKDLRGAMSGAQVNPLVCPKVIDFCPVDERTNEEFVNELSSVTALQDIDHLCLHPDPAVQQLCQENRPVLEKLVQVMVKWNRMPEEVCGVHFKFLRMVDGNFYRQNGEKVAIPKRDASKCTEKLIKAAVELRQMQLRHLQEVVVASNRNEVLEANLSETDLIAKLMTHIRHKDHVCRSMFQATKLQKAITFIRGNVAVNPFAFTMIIFAVMCLLVTLRGVLSIAATLLMIRFISQMASSSMNVVTSVEDYFRAVKMRKQGLSMRNNFLAAHLMQGVAEVNSNANLNE